MNTRFPSPRRVAAVTAGAILSMMALAGCSHDETPAPNVVTVPAAPAPSAAPAVGSPGATTPDTKINTNAGPGTSNGTDTALADTVNTAIVHNKQMTGSRVEVVATGGVVTLNGQVQNQQQKALAQTTTTQVPGVASVKNKLIIVTTGGAKPKPMVITKTKTIIVHDNSVPPAAPTDTGTTDNGQAPAAPASPEPSTTPEPSASPAPTSNP